MRVTRSRSLKIATIIPDAVERVEKKVTTKSTVHIKEETNGLTVLDSLTVTVKSKALEDDSSEPPLQVPATPTKKKREGKTAESPRKRTPRVHIEERFSHIVTPADLKLPPSFVENHVPSFVEGVAHVLSKDSSLYPIVAFGGDFRPFLKSGIVLKDDSSDEEKLNHYWFSLVSSVISQQVSGHAARAIAGRFKALFNGTPTPQEALTISPEALRGAGLLGMKVKYVASISEAFVGDGKLTQASFYQTATTAEMVEALTMLKGIGEWLAKMFMVFTLFDLDVFAHDDLGVARGVARYLEARPQKLAEIKQAVQSSDELKAGLKKKPKFGADKAKRDWVPLHDEYLKYLASQFAPYRLVFMLIMWRMSATNIDVLETA